MKCLKLDDALPNLVFSLFLFVALVTRIMLFVWLFEPEGLYLYNLFPLTKCIQVKVRCVVSVPKHEGIVFFKDIQILHQNPPEVASVEGL